MSQAVALAEVHPTQYGAKPFTSETAREAGRKGNETIKRLRDLAKANGMIAVPQDASSPSARAAVAEMRRTQRRLLRQACATTISSEALEFVKAASMVFEMECVLTGRKVTRGRADSPPGKLKPSDDIPLPLELPPSDTPPPTLPTTEELTAHATSHGL